MTRWDSADLDPTRWTSGTKQTRRESRPERSVPPRRWSRRTVGAGGVVARDDRGRPGASLATVLSASVEGDGRSREGSAQGRRPDPPARWGSTASHRRPDRRPTRPTPRRTRRSAGWPPRTASALTSPSTAALCRAWAARVRWAGFAWSRGRSVGRSRERSPRSAAPGASSPPGWSGPSPRRGWRPRTRRALRDSSCAELVVPMPAWRPDPLKMSDRSERRSQR